MNPSRNLRIVASLLFVTGLALPSVSCRKKVDPALEAATSEIDLQLEIEREMLAMEREMLALERVQLEEDRATALAEAESASEAARAAEADAERARQELANANANARQVAPAPSSSPRVQNPQPPRSGGTVPGYSAPYPAGYQGGQRPVAHTDYRLFYEELRPHGSWFETGSYGYVWQPEIARRSRDWRPYTQGRWMDTDQGWAWWSEEPFGWATYHYGRWTLFDNVGWVWVPGPDWAPAWVSWRESGDYIGWAPLPPVTLYETRFNYGQRTDAVCGIPPYHYNFVPVNQFAGPVHQHYVPPTQNVQIIQKTTNVTYIHVHNETVIVNGPRPEPLRERFGRERMPYHTLSRNDWSPDRRGNPAPRQQGSIIEFKAPIVAILATSQAQPTRVERRLDQLVPTHPAAKADGEIVQRFVRERARQEVEAVPIEAAPTAPAGSSASAPAPAVLERPKAVEEIRQSISEREARIEELNRQRETAVATAVAEAQAPATAPTTTEPAQEQTKTPDPVPVPAQPTLATEPAPIPEPAKVPEPAPIPEPAPATEPAPIPEPVPATEPAPFPEPESAPVQSDAPLGTPLGTPEGKGMPGDRRFPKGGSSDSRPGDPRQGASQKGSIEARMEEIRKRQEELRNRTSPGSRTGSSPAAPAAPAAPMPVVPEPAAASETPPPAPETRDGATTPPAEPPAEMKRESGTDPIEPEAPTVPAPAGAQPRAEAGAPTPPQPGPSVGRADVEDAPPSAADAPPSGRMQNSRESAAEAMRAKMRADQEERAAKADAERKEGESRRAEMQARMRAEQDAKAAKADAERKEGESRRAEMQTRMRAEQEAKAAKAAPPMPAAVEPLPEKAEEPQPERGRDLQERRQPPGRGSADSPDRSRRGPVPEMENKGGEQPGKTEPDQPGNLPIAPDPEPAPPEVPQPSSELPPIPEEPGTPESPKPSSELPSIPEQPKVPESPGEVKEPEAPK